MDHLSPQEKQQRRSDFITDVAIGMSDGLTVPFALTAGLSAVLSDTSTLIIAGIAAICAGSAAMSWGGYLAGKTTNEEYQDELVKNEGLRIPTGKENIKEFFANIGLSEELQQRAAEELIQDRKQWADFMMRHGLMPDKHEPRRAIKSALNIGVSYVLGGLIPLFPYFFTPIPKNALPVSVAITLIALFIIGFLKNRITASNPWLGAFRMMLIGAIAAGAAFGVVKVVSQF